ncbi:hypothetical protein [Stakelama tenebrarum]|uniref:Uncharacterized protein n=1 Tax=Stakelama tenebrarum TaxID=2711215 RepID=A0A6G6Y076_9SPHN|nr:hypothetical protein [Sphingosinithalassobacter tenebrarum]QIG78322.1 hypothetical protein G5C33_04970 [Sphingosinithalassobacter tenebrarum]
MVLAEGALPCIGVKISCLIERLDIENDSQLQFYIDADRAGVAGLHCIGATA